MIFQKPCGWLGVVIFLCVTVPCGAQTVDLAGYWFGQNGSLFRCEQNQESVRFFIVKMDTAGRGRDVGFSEGDLIIRGRIEDRRIKGEISTANVVRQQCPSLAFPWAEFLIDVAVDGRSLSARINIPAVDANCRLTGQSMWSPSLPLLKRAPSVSPDTLTFVPLVNGGYANPIREPYSYGQKFAVQATYENPPAPFVEAELTWLDQRRFVLLRQQGDTTLYRSDALEFTPQGKRP